MNRVKIVLYAILALLICVDIGLSGYIFLENHNRTVMLADYFRNGLEAKSTNQPVGYSSTGMRLNVVPGTGKGWVVRYASTKCEFCRADEAQWSALKSLVINAGYHIYYISPDGMNSYMDRPAEQPTETQISFVDIDWMKRYRLTGTPTTLLFNNCGNLIWAHTGTMSAVDQQDVSRALTEANKEKKCFSQASAK